MLNYIKRYISCIYYSFRRYISCIYYSFRLFFSSKDKIVICQKKIDGYEIVCPINEDVGRRTFFYNDYEKSDTIFLRRIIKPYFVCFDIGANIGNYTLLLSVLCKKGQIHSFEPVPLNYWLLSTSICINGFKNIILNQIALSDHESMEKFCVPSDSGYASFVDTGRKPIKSYINVNVCTVDSYIRKNNIKKVHFIKMDIEGAEKLVINGSKLLFLNVKMKPSVLLIELCSANLQAYNTNINDIIDVLYGYGYKPYILENQFLINFKKEHYDNNYNVYFIESKFFENKVKSFLGEG